MSTPRTKEIIAAAAKLFKEKGYTRPRSRMSPMKWACSGQSLLPYQEQRRTTLPGDERAHSRADRAPEETHGIGLVATAKDP
jgi:hypothetical protein